MSMSMSMKGRESIRKSEAKVISPGNNRQTRQDNTRQGMAQREREEGILNVKVGWTVRQTCRQRRHIHEDTQTGK